MISTFSSSSSFLFSAACAANFKRVALRSASVSSFESTLKLDDNDGKLFGRNIVLVSYIGIEYNIVTYSSLITSKTA